MRRILQVLLQLLLWLTALGVVGVACIDSGAVRAFECDDSGRCVSGHAGQGGGDGSGSGGGAGAPCGPDTCAGCCVDGQCRAGTSDEACGQSGGLCAACGTGERCQSSTCLPAKANGSACTAPEQCTSGACVDGLCCSSSCTGACQTCAEAGHEGECRLRPEGSAVAACHPRACDGLSADCPTTCTSARQCVPGTFCSDGGCNPVRDAGAGCASNGECASTFCADGVCCDKACSGSCDRCDLPAAVGACRPVTQGNPGSPACGASVVCNGTLVDCPFLCSAGCPPNTWCSGTYCSAKKPAGTVCATAQECLSGSCADGVCCNLPCAGACDACSVAQGATSDGTCTLLGSSRLCRAAAGACDVEERCTGTSDACPPDVFSDAGAECPGSAPSYTAWSECDGGSACALTGEQARLRTDYRCGGGVACVGASTPETRPCARTTEGLSCAAPTYGSWTACAYAASCDASGTRSRSRTLSSCAAGVCAGAQGTEVDTAGCTRDPTGLSCGSSSYGQYTSCSYANTCSVSGSRSRSRTDAVCQASACGTRTVTESDTSGCVRSTTGVPCGTTVVEYGTCTYANTCATTGSRTRTTTTFTCNGSGTCAGTPVVDTDTAGCARATENTSCGTTSCGACGACDADCLKFKTCTSYTCRSSVCVSSTDEVHCGNCGDPCIPK